MHVLKGQIATEALLVLMTHPLFFLGGCLLHMDGTLTETSSETPEEMTTDTQEGIYIPPPPL